MLQVAWDLNEEHWAYVVNRLAGTCSRLSQSSYHQQIALNLTTTKIIKLASNALHYLSNIIDMKKFLEKANFKIKKNTRLTAI